MNEAGPQSPRPHLPGPPTIRIPVDQLALGINLRVLGSIPSIPAIVRPHIFARSESGTLLASSIFWKRSMFGANPDGLSSVPNTTCSHAPGPPLSVCGLSTASSVAHQRISLILSNRPSLMNFRRVEPVMSKHRFGFHRSASAASSYQGLPKWAP